MGDEAAAKKDKTVAKRNFTRAHRELCEAIDDDDDEELVKEKYGLLTKKWANVQENYESSMKFLRQITMMKTLNGMKSSSMI